MASCASCNAEVPGGVRWCSMCHANVLDASIGRLASPGKRLGAYFLDVAVPILALTFIVGASGLGIVAGGERAGGALGSPLGFELFLGSAFWVQTLFARGATPGKHLLDMRVVNENEQPAGFGTMLFREWIGKFISGQLWILIDKDRKGWHDRLASTYVVDG